MPSLFEAYGLTEPEAVATKPELEPRGFTGVAKDVGISALKGAIAVPESAVGLADLVTGGYAGKAAEAVGFRPAEAKAMLDEQYSQEQKDAFARVQAAQGFGDTLMEAVRNPSVIGHSVVESLPSMGAGGVLARGGLALAPALSPVLAGAFGEGAVQAGSAAEQTRQASPDKLLSARGAGAAALSGVLDTAIAAGSGGLAKRLGIVDVDTLLAGAKTSPTVAKGLTRRVLEGMFTEGVLEELPQSIQEQVLQNYGMGKPLDEGVDQAAVLGMLSGAAMGGGANVIGSHATETAAATAPLPEPTGPLSRAAAVAAQQPVAAATGMEAPAAAAPQEPVVDPVVDRINKLQGVDRSEALAAYNILNRDDAPKGVRQYNSRLLDELLAKLEPKEEGAAPVESSDPAALLASTMGRDPVQGALEEQRNHMAALQNLDNWMARAQPLALDHAQELQAAAGERGLAMEVVPHAEGQGYTVVPSEWITPAMRGQVATALPLDTTPTGVMRADATGNVAPETGAQAINARNVAAAQAAERQRKNDLGLTPDVEAVQAGAKRAPKPEPLPTDVKNKKGEPFKNKGAALRAQKAAGGGDVIEVQGGWVVRTAAAAPAVQQELEGSNVSNGDAAVAVAAGDGGKRGDDAGTGRRDSAAPGGDAGRAVVHAAAAPATGGAEGQPVRDAAGESAAAVAEAPAADEQDHHGLRAEDRRLRAVDSHASELAAQFMQESQEPDFDPSDLPGALANWAKDANIPADDLRPAVLKALDRFDGTKAQRDKIRRALDPTKAAKQKPADATAPGSQRWSDADAAERERLLLAAGWKAGSPGLEKMKAQAWDKMTQAQRNRITKAIGTAPAPKQETSDAQKPDRTGGDGGEQPAAAAAVPPVRESGDAADTPAAAAPVVAAAPAADAPASDAAATVPAGGIAAPATEPKPVKPRTTTAASDAIGDFGEKIIGARKDYAALMKDAMEVDVGTEPLSKSWPEPDYQKLLDGGADSFVVAWIHASRDEVPTRPQKAWRLRPWVQQVTLLRDVANKMLNGEIAPEKLREKLAQAEWARLHNEIGGRAELYERLGHQQSLKGVTVESHSYTFYKGVDYKPAKTMWTVERKAKATAFSNWPSELAMGDTREAAIAAFVEKVKAAPADAEKKTASFDLWRENGKVHVGKKMGRQYVTLKKFDGTDAAAVKEARAYRDAHLDELTAALEKYRSTPFERRSENQPRVGDDHRGGARVTPEVFHETFGFRGVQFGNYVENGRRQQDLNDAYDGLMDMAAVIGVPPRALSLNGRLGLAFGARGKGGKNAPSAHYESGHAVINLTKGGGAGALAHEWFHALDNYFGQQEGIGYQTSGLKGADVVRQEMREAFKKVMAAIKAGKMQARSLALDERRSKPYWSTNLELGARAYEAYIIAKLQDQNAANDYLANIVSEQFWNAQEALSGHENEKTYPYPTEAEMGGIRDAFDAFFRTLETKPGDNGNVVMFKRADGKPVGNDLTERAAAVQQFVDRVTKGWANAPEIIVVPNMQDPRVPEFARETDDAQRNQGSEGEVHGFHYQGKVYLVASALTDANTALTTLAHEALGHYGLQGFFGEALKPIKQQIVAMRRKEVVAKAEAYGMPITAEAVRAELGKGATDADVQKVINLRLMYAAEEVLAEMAQTTPQLGFVKRAVAAIRTWLREHVPGFADMQLTDDEIVRSFILPARGWVVHGTGTGATMASSDVLEREFGLPAAEASDPLVREFVDRAARADAEEKESDPDDWTKEQRAAYDGGNWREFSRLRGYTRAEVDNFGRFMELAKAVDAKYGDGYAQGLHFGIRQSGDAAQFSRGTVNRREFIVGTAAALAAQDAKSETTLGKAKALDTASVNARVSAEVEKILVGNGKGTTNIEGAKALRQALEKIAETGPKELRALAGEIAKLVPKDTLMLSVEAKDMNAHGALEFSPVVRLRLFDGPKKISQGLRYSTLLHEALHAAVAARYKALSSGVLRSNDAVLGMAAPQASKAMEQFTAVWKEFGRVAKPALNSMKEEDPLYIHLEQATGDPDEFFVRALTDPELQGWMARQEYKGETLLQRFVNWVKTSLLGFKKEGTVPSWLDAALLASDDLLKAMGGDPADFKRLRASNALADRQGQRDAVKFDRVAGNTPATARPLRESIMQAMNDTFTAPGKLNWWHKTVGTQYNLAQRSPQFKRVFDGVQDFLNDVSLYATEAADLAPKILPKLETWRDIGKAPISAEDNKAVSAPVFEGTLLWARDERGRPAKVEELRTQAQGLSAEAKAQRMLRAGAISENVLKMWKGLPIEQYEQAVATRFESQMLRPGVVWSEDELRSQFKLSDAQIALYKEFRASVDRSLTHLAVSDMVRFGGKDVEAVRQEALDAGDVDAAALILRDHLLELADKQPDRNELLIDTAERMIDKADRARDLMDHGYAPLSRFGHYTVDAIDENGERVYFGMFESAREAALMARKMQANFPKAKITRGTVSQEEYKLFAGVSPETVELFGELLGLEAQGDDAASKAFQTYVKVAKANRSAMKRLIERKGIAGFSEDVGRVLAGFVYSNARQTSQNLHMGQMTDAAAAVTDPEKGGSKSLGELKDAATRLVEYVKNPQEEAQGFRGLLFAQYLGGSVASAIVNMLQPVQVTFPYLSQYGGVAKAAARMTAAFADVRKKTTGDAALDAALKKAEEEGIVAPQEVHQLMAQAQGRGVLKSGDGTVAGDVRARASNAFSRLSLAWGKVFGAAEQLNRRVTFIAAYRTAVDQGIADPAGFAEKAIAETQFVYNKGNKPQWARGAIGSTLFTFKQYSVSYVELLHRMATQGGPEGKKAALLALGMLFLFSGAGGLPFAEDAEDLVDGVMQRLGYNFSTKLAKKQFFEKMLGKDLGRFAEHGLSGLPGVPIDVSGRLGLGNLIPGTGLLVDKEDHTRDATEFLGAGGDFATRLFKGANQLAQGNVAEAGKLVSPRASANAAKALEMYSTGQYKDDKGRKVIDVDGFEATMKALGFQPTDVARVQEATGLQQQMIAGAKQASSRFAEAWAKAVAEGDQAALQSVREDIRSWNEKNPDSRVVINRSQIAQRVKAMREDKATRIERTAPKAIRANVRRELEGS